MTHTTRGRTTPNRKAKTQREIDREEKEREEEEARREARRKEEEERKATVKAGAERGLKEATDRGAIEIKFDKDLTSEERQRESELRERQVRAQIARAGFQSPKEKAEAFREQSEQALQQAEVTEEVKQARATELGIPSADDIFSVDEIQEQLGVNLTFGNIKELRAQASIRGPTGKFFSKERRSLSAQRGFDLKLKQEKLVVARKRERIGRFEALFQSLENYSVFFLGATIDILEIPKNFATQGDPFTVRRAEESLNNTLELLRRQAEVAAQTGSAISVERTNRLLRTAVRQLGALEAAWHAAGQTNPNFFYDQGLDVQELLQEHLEDINNIIERLERAQRVGRISPSALSIAAAENEQTQ